MITNYKIFEKRNMIGSKSVCTNILCFGRMLKRKGFVSINNIFRVRVLIKGDGNELERTFDIEVEDVTGLSKQDKGFRGYDWDSDEVSVMGWNFYSEESESREIFYSQIEDIIQDMNVGLNEGSQADGSKEIGSSLSGLEMYEKIEKNYGDSLKWLEKPSGVHSETIELGIKKDKISKIYPRIIKFIEHYNWYSSKPENHSWMVIRAKYGKEVITQVPEIVYHATPMENFEKILKDGLHARSEDIRHKYPPRVYLSTDVNSLYPLIRELKRYKDNKKYGILGINTVGLNLKLYKDQQSLFRGNCYIQEMDIPANKIWIYDDNGI